METSYEHFGSERKKRTNMCGRLASDFEYGINLKKGPSVCNSMSPKMNYTVSLYDCAFF